MDKARAVAEAHEIMGNGKIASCRRQVRKGCRNCCTTGAPLFEGEDLGELPEGVRMVGQKVVDCLGPKGCKFSNKKKPLVCKAFPVIAPIAHKNGQLKEMIFTIDNADCPATIPDDFAERARRAAAVLSEAGLMEPKLYRINPNKTYMQVGELSLGSANRTTK